MAKSLDGSGAEAVQLGDDAVWDDLAYRADGRLEGVRGLHRLRLESAAVAGKGLIRVSPFAGGRSGSNSPSRISTCCLKVMKVEQASR
jgi:hypothetical protein